MKRELVILSLPGGDGFAWRLTEDGRQSFGRGGVDEIAAIGHDRLVCLLATEDVFVSRQPRPPGRERQVRRAVPFVIEEQLASDLDSVHVASAPAPDGDGLLVAAVARERLDALLAGLGAAGLRPDLVAPDCLALPWRQGRLTLAVGPDRFVARLPDGSGAAMETAALPAWLDLVLAGQGEAGPELVVCDCGGAAGVVPESARVVQGPRDRPLPPVGDAPLVLPLDFLCGDYADRGRVRSLPRPVVAAAVGLAVWSGIGCLSTALDYARAGREEKRLAAMIEQVYRRTFPGETVVVDPRGQMEKKLAAVAGRAGDGMLRLLARAAPVLLRAGGFRLRRLSYDGRGLTLDMELASIAEFDRVRGAVAARLGRTVKTGQIRRSGSGVRGELRIGGEEGR